MDFVLRTGTEYEPGTSVRKRGHYPIISLGGSRIWEASTPSDSALYAKERAQTQLVQRFCQLFNDEGA